MPPRRPQAVNSSASVQSTASSLKEGLNTGSTGLNLPVVLISPIKARAVKKTIVGKTDIEVWHLPDQEIIGM